MPFFHRNPARPPRRPRPAAPPPATAGQSAAMRLRVRILAGAMALTVAGVLVARLAWLQLADSTFYAARAARQQMRSATVPAPRGDIWSSDGTLLAGSVTCWTIRAVPREMQEELLDAAAADLAEILNEDAESFAKKFADRKSNDALLARRVDRETADAVRAYCESTGLSGIRIQQDTKRLYPEGDFAASILGFTNVDGDGLAGLELKYNETLTGTEGSVLTARNAWGYDLEQAESIYQAPVQGNSLTLTIDANIQHYLEQHLTYAVQEHNVSARAVGIVMDVNTGAILAMATKPDYDPNQPRLIADETTRAAVDALTGEERTAALQLAQQTQWRNKAVSDLYEPGSVFKLITASAALDCGAVQPLTQFTCGKSYKVSGVAFHCANNKAHGLLTVQQAVAQSCNQSLIQIGQLLGKERFYQYFEAFGLTGATGIDLPAEPARSEYYTAERMGPVELASCSFGQSSKITPIQMITAVAAVVNGGKLMQSYVVAKVTDATGNTVSETQPQVRRQVITEETSAAMREILELTVLEGGGKNAYVAGYRVGGKSGTSQKLDSEDEKARIASFVGVAPIDDPQIAVLICLDEPHSFTTAGGSLSAPVVAQVIEDTLSYWGVPRVYTQEELDAMQTTVPSLAGSAPDKALERLANNGLTGKVVGEGETVLRQYPEAGQTLPRGSTVLLYTTDAQPLSVTVPSLAGQSYDQAVAALRAAGLNLCAEGPAWSQGAVAVSQSLTEGQSVPMGSVVTARFCDYSAVDD